MPSERGSWFRIKFRPGSDQEGLAIAVGYQTGVRKWNLRAVVLPDRGNKLIASFQFFYNGESRDLPGGGQKMRWRPPVNDRMVEQFDSWEIAVSTLFVRAKARDELAESVFQEASAKNRSFNSQLIDDLVNGRTPSADELASRMASTNGQQEPNCSDDIPARSVGDLRASWSGWTRNENELSAQYAFLSATQDTTEATIRLRVRMVQRLWRAATTEVTVLVTPGLGYPDCWLVGMLAADPKSETTGFIAVHAKPDKGGTLITFGKAETDKVINLLRAGRDVVFQLSDTSETVLNLPLRNDSSFNSEYIKISG